MGAWFEFNSLRKAEKLPASLLPDLPLPRPPARTLRRSVQSHRAIFISDIHLGTRNCKAEALANFLARNDCQTLYLVGDIVDGWRLKRRWHWPDAHSRVLHEILHKIDRGRRVIYVPGNH